MEKNNKSNQTSKNKKNSHKKWIITVFFMTLAISACFSLVSNLVMSSSEMFIALIVLLIIVFIGILFDIIGVAVTASDEKAIHGMASRRVKGAAEAVNLINNANKVSSICNDVIGDICGVISGSATTAIVSKILLQINMGQAMEMVLPLAMSALVAALTVTGKAIGKVSAINNSTQIVFTTGKAIAFFKGLFSFKKGKKMTDIFVREDENGLYITDGRLSFRGDFESMLPRIKRANTKTELILRAVKIKKEKENTWIIDATAGLGEDSLILASAGYNVIMYEKDPIIAALLADAMKRAEANPYLFDIVKRMTLVNGDSIDAMKKLNQKADVILLDPMFPERNKSALIKKKFQLIHHLEAPCSNEEELLAAAFEAKPRKIVIKRPLKGSNLADRKPEYTIAGKAIRYDCFVLAV